MEKLNYDYIEQYFKNNDCKLIDKEYKNSKVKMSYICKCGNYSYINFSNFKSGRRCKKCMGNNLAKDRKKDKKEIELLFLENGCKLLGEYRNMYSPVSYLCSCGKENKISVANFKQGRRCKECGIEKRSKENHYNWCLDRKKIKDNLSIRKRCYSMLFNSLKVTGRKKCGRTRDLLGYTGKQLQNHIRSHPNWDEVKDKDWEIDHIFPIKAFIDIGILDIKIINTLDNLMPVLKSVNRKKSKKYAKKEFSHWLKSKEVVI